MLDGLRLVGMSKRESLLEIEKKNVVAEKYCYETCKGYSPKMSLSLGHTQDASFPVVALSW